MAARHAHVQSSDAPPRPGTLHADASRRQAGRHRPDFAAGVSNGFCADKVAMTEKSNVLPQLLTDLDSEYEQLKQNPNAFVTWTSSSANSAIYSYLSQITDLSELNDARSKLLGKTGRISFYLSQLPNSSADIRPRLAAQINPVKSQDQQIIEARHEALKDAAL